MNNSQPSQQNQSTLLLQYARGLLRKGWCRGSYAEDSSGNTVYWDNKRATCFCAYGALYRAEYDNDTNTTTFNYAVNRLINLMGDDEIRSLFVYNDTHSKEEVIALFDKAIANEQRLTDPSH